jgi:hypothetical protein
VEKFEREFFMLAFNYFACRYQVMTNQPPPHGKGYRCKTVYQTMEYAMLGEKDNKGEMRLLCKEVLKKA